MTSSSSRPNIDRGRRRSAAARVTKVHNRRQITTTVRPVPAAGGHERGTEAVKKGGKVIVRKVLTHRMGHGHKSMLGHRLSMTTMTNWIDDK